MSNGKTIPAAVKLSDRTGRKSVVKTRNPQITFDIEELEECIIIRA